jgi:NAD(P)-dependent dehydrogenase (short-subunit alcohol dehydrogenase family)
MKQLTEQVILITGATDGLGKMVATDLAKKGPTLLLHGRNPDKGKLVLNEIRQSTGNPNLFYYNADFTSLQQVAELAQKINKEQKKIDVLINNAGMGGNKNNQREISEDGYELRFAVNYLAPFLFTHLLLPLLIKSAPSKIVNVGSGAQEPIDFNDVMIEKDYAGLRAYSQSKIAILMFTLDLAEQLKGSGVTVNCVHPASLMDTKIVMDYFGYANSTIKEGADSVEFVATSPELDGISGAFFNRTTVEKGHPWAYNLKAREKLHDLSLKLSGLQT